MDSALRIAPCRREDLQAVADLHVGAFPDSVLTAFGSEAVRRYYQWLVEGPHDAAVVLAWRGERLVGFCAAGWFRGAMRDFLRTNRMYLAGYLARHPSLLRTPLVRERIRLAARLAWRFSRVHRRTVADTTQQHDARRFGILSIATHPDVRGSGAGRALMMEAEARARLGAYETMLLTVHPSNTRAVAFYEQLGWTRRPSTDGTWTGSMEKRVT